MRKKQRHVTLFIALMLLFTVWALKPSVSESEAWWLWVVRDVVDVQPAAPGDVLRGGRANLSSAISRSEGGLKLPVAAVLEGWTWLAGDSLEALRWGGVLVVSLAAAVVLRLVGRRAPHTTWRALGVLLVLAPALIVVQPADSISAELAAYQAARTPAEPVLTLFSESSRLGYYQHRYDLRAGLGINLGWREFSPQELMDIADNLDSTRPVWLIAPRHDLPAVYTLVGYLTQTGGRQIPYSFTLDDKLTVMQFR